MSVPLFGRLAPSSYNTGRRSPSRFSRKTAPIQRNPEVPRRQRRMFPHPRRSDGVRRRRDRSITARRLSLALAGILVCIAAGAVRAAPAAEAGVLDLSSWSFERDGSVPLTGQWELYWGRLVDPAALAASQEPSPHLVHVPGSWNDL